MGKMPDALRETIARNIRDCRILKYPGRGGGKRCAESFGVSPQQWSPWESGKRTPDELRLEQIASFFSTTVEWFRRDHRSDFPPAQLGTPANPGPGTIIRSQVIGGDLSPRTYSLPQVAVADTDEENIAHYLWVIEILTRKLTASGIRVAVTFERAANMLTGS